MRLALKRPVAIISAKPSELWTKKYHILTIFNGGGVNAYAFFIILQIV